ncbi:ThiF family adenylyltransferase [Fulvivirgaceae bacterium BMA10]|uniref:ThiF family adenylyltransferase n=1 Tax=Splendidivirga corallicola TaxID=3051826 RepID=A0ABT8KT49_9BACT|nr:ThiF family adenylyltransferase [Fulvivirgaceae bacterium BMA10]
MQFQLRISGIHHQQLQDHLFPGDGLEAVAVALCGLHISNELTILTVHELLLIPYDQCERSERYVYWRTEVIVPLLEKAALNKFSFAKIHSHTTDYPRFSPVDNKSDYDLFPSIYGWFDSPQPHVSLVMLPKGELFGRVVSLENKFIPLNKITLVGNQLKFWKHKTTAIVNKEVTLRNRQTLGKGTVNLLKQMKIAVVGASGTGSPTVEQLARLGVGHLVLIDPDKIERKNLNRILNSTLEHAKRGIYKVDVLAKIVKRMGFDTNISTFKVNLYNSREAINELISSDVIFGCVDSIDGRHLINQIATFYLIPYFDIGVKLEADENGGINQINGAVHYLQPGGSSLFSRGVYTMKGLEAAALLRQNPNEYKRRLSEKYIVNLPVESPAVISFNMQVSSYGVNEFLDRIHSFKGTDAIERAAHFLAISEGMIFTESDGEPDTFLEKRVGRGDMTPFIEMPEL